MLSWAEGEGAAVIPFGGGTSVVGGVEARLGERPVVTMDLRRLDRVLEVDPESLAARIQAGAHRAAARRTAARARPHPAPLPAVVRVLDARRLDRDPGRRPLRHPRDPHRRPGRVGAGDHSRAAPGRAGGCRARARGHRPDRMLLGSEGILGVITEAWVRVRPRPEFKASRGVEFDDFLAAARRRAGDRAVGPLPGQLPPARRLRGGADRRRRRRGQPADPRLRVGPPPGRRGDGGWPSRSPATTAAPDERADGPARLGSRSGPARTRSAPGAGRSCWRPTCATPSSPAACSRRPSRRRSPGIASRSSTRG